MSAKRPRHAATRLASFLGAAAISVASLAEPATAQSMAYMQAVAEASVGEDAIGAFYRDQDYAPLWTGEGEPFRTRRAALIDALRSVGIHGLPEGRYDVPALIRELESARTTRDLGRLEVDLSRVFLRYARDVQTGMLTPSEIDPGIVRKVQYRDRKALLEGLLSADPHAYMVSLAPETREYRNLMSARLRLQRAVEYGTWGPAVPASSLKPGDSGEAVVALRNRLIAMGYMERTFSADYDLEMDRAIRAFQAAHGLEQDGVAGSGTMDEVNVPAEERLKSVLVAMERERWTNFDRGDRHILVNQTDFTARIVDLGEVTFETRAVIGANSSDRRSPEFSDEMEHMIVNPSWHVPRSIITNEYLPQLRANPMAAGHLIITDARGRRIDRTMVDFNQFSARNFPFDMRQPPSRSNALGLVKFMFPNRYNIYLHDTPAKNLFSRESRAFSHGCIRLADPFDFAYALLARQSDDPEGLFQRTLATGQETKIELEQKVPVHLIYRTAFTDTRGQLNFRRDVYGRDARIWEALSRAGVELTPIQG